MLKIGRSAENGEHTRIAEDSLPGFGDHDDFIRKTCAMTRTT